MMYECFTFYVCHLIASLKSMHLPLPLSESEATRLHMRPKECLLEVESLSQKAAENIKTTSSQDFVKQYAYECK